MKWTYFILLYFVILFVATAVGVIKCYKCEFPRVKGCGKRLKKGGAGVQKKTCQRTDKFCSTVITYSANKTISKVVRGCAKSKVPSTGKNIKRTYCKRNYCNGAMRVSNVASTLLPISFIFKVFEPK